MKWSESQVVKLRELCYQGKSNREIATSLGCDVKDVYAKRSQLGLTIDKCKGALSNTEISSMPSSRSHMVEKEGEMSGKLMCPLMSTHCQEKECAWWSSEDKGCAILTFGKAFTKRYLEISQAG